MLRGVRQLGPGELLVCDSAGVQVRSYWDLKFDPEAGVTEDEWAQRVREKLDESTRIRLVSDVPFGAFLSGGVDSSTNVALMSRLVSTPLQTFTVEFTGFGPAENFHDVPYARQVASMFGCNHTEVQVTAQEALAYVPEMVQQQDEPLGDPACLPMHFVSRAAHKAGIKVVLVGEGSDEVFCGYPDFPRLYKTFNGRWSLLKRMAKMLYKSSPVGVVLARPSGERIVAKQAERSVTITGEPGELVLHGFGRDAVRVEIDGDPADVTAFGTVSRGV
jgi:asparagine synthase (glutamine-hydrolysing)